LLLDTHIVVRWLASPKRLSRDQARALREAVRRHEPVGVSSISLLEIAVLVGEGAARTGVPLRELLEELEESPAFEIVHLTPAIAAEVSAIGSALRDPADRGIVATARVNKLTLVTSDQRIIDSGLVNVIS
jgi:PIN domain nuclease of toxin-antitoxin system